MMPKNRVSYVRAEVQVEQLPSTLMQNLHSSWRPSLGVRPNVERSSVPPRPGMIYIGDALKAWVLMLKPCHHSGNVGTPPSMLLRHGHEPLPSERRGAGV